MDVIAPPNDKIAILKKIQKLLCLLSLLEGLFLLSQRIAPKTIFLLASSGVYWVSWRQLSYFGCILNQIFNLCIIWILLLQMATKLENGLYEIYLSSEGIYKMASLISCIVSIYFSLSAYQTYKQLALQIYDYQNNIDASP